MTASIPITGYPSTYRAPFVAGELIFNQGPSTASAAARSALYVGPMLSTGSATVNTVYQIRTEQDAITYFGVGSPLHRACRKHLRVNKRGALYALPIPASTGVGLVAATGTITVTMGSSNPTAKGIHTSYVCGEEIQSYFDTTDTVTTLGDTIAAKINALVHLPVTAANSGGVVTLTAKLSGVSQGDGTIGVIRFRSKVEGGKGVTTADSGAALGLGTGTAGVDGATTEAAGLQTALATVATARYYYMGITAVDATSIGYLKSHVSTKSDPSPGLRSRGFAAYPHTLAGAQAIAIAQNYERFHLACQINSEHDAAELCAYALAIHQLKESDDPGFAGFDGLRNNELLPAYAQSDWPSDGPGGDADNAVSDGVMLFGSDQSGGYLVMSVTTRSKDSTGLIDDFRSTETHRVSIMDNLLDTILQRWRVQYTTPGFRLRDDQYLADGITPNPNQVVPPKTLTPSRVRPWLLNIYREFDEIGLIQDLPSWQDGQKIQIDPNNVARLQFGGGGRTADICHQAAFVLAETSPG